MIATLPFVEDKFHYFNELCFGGALPPIPFSLVKARSFLGKVEYVRVRGLFGREVGRSDFRMKISVSFDLPEAELEDVVLHEMIHYYIAVRGIKDSSAHGDVFRGMMNDFNARFGRHITVRHRMSADSQRVASRKESPRYVCVSTFRDGRMGVTVCSETKVQYLRRALPQCFSLQKMEWFVSRDPFFTRFPRARTPKIYRISQQDLAQHLADAERV